MVVAHTQRVVRGRRGAALSGSGGGLHRQDLQGGEAPPAVQHQGGARRRMMPPAVGGLHPAGP